MKRFHGIRADAQVWLPSILERGAKEWTRQKEVGVRHEGLSKENWLVELPTELIRQTSFLTTVRNVVSTIQRYSIRLQKLPPSLTVICPLSTITLLRLKYINAEQKA